MFILKVLAGNDVESELNVSVSQIVQLIDFFHFWRRKLSVASSGCAKGM